MFTEARLRRWLLVGTPIALGIVFFIHPRQFDEFSIRDAPIWTTAHVAETPLVGLLILSMIVLVKSYLEGRQRLIGLVGTWFFGVFFLTQEGIKGIGAAFLLRGGQELSIDERQNILLPRVSDYSGDPVVFVFGLLAGLGYLATLGALAMGLGRHGVTMPPRALMAVAGLTGLVLVSLHGGPFGMVPMLLLAAAVFWTETGDWRPPETTD